MRKKINLSQKGFLYLLRQPELLQGLDEIARQVAQIKEKDVAHEEQKILQEKSILKKAKAEVEAEEKSDEAQEKIPVKKIGFWQDQDVEIELDETELEAIRSALQTKLVSLQSEESSAAAAAGVLEEEQRNLESLLRSLALAKVDQRPRAHQVEPDVNVPHLLQEIKDSDGVTTRTNVRILMRAITRHREFIPVRESVEIGEIFLSAAFNADSPSERIELCVEEIEKMIAEEGHENLNLTPDLLDIALSKAQYWRNYLIRESDNQREVRKAAGDALKEVIKVNKPDDLLQELAKELGKIIEQVELSGDRSPERMTACFEALDDLADEGLIDKQLASQVWDNFTAKLTTGRRGLKQDAVTRIPPALLSKIQTDELPDLKARVQNFILAVPDKDKIQVLEEIMGKIISANDENVLLKIECCKQALIETSNELWNSEKASLIQRVYDVLEKEKGRNLEVINSKSPNEFLTKAVRNIMQMAEYQAEEDVYKYERIHLIDKTKSNALKEIMKAAQSAGIERAELCLGEIINFYNGNEERLLIAEGELMLKEMRQEVVASKDGREAPVAAAQLLEELSTPSAANSEDPDSSVSQVKKSQQLSPPVDRPLSLS